MGEEGAEGELKQKGEGKGKQKGEGKGEQKGEGMGEQKGEGKREQKEGAERGGGTFSLDCKNTFIIGFMSHMITKQSELWLNTHTSQPESTFRVHRSPPPPPPPPPPSVV